MSARVGRYVLPLSAVPLTRENVTRVARTLRTAWHAADEAALPLILGVDVADDARLLDLDGFQRLYDPVRPVLLSLSGTDDPLLNPRLPGMVAHATAAGTRVTLVTDGTRLDPGRAYALLDAGLAAMEVTIERWHAAERVLRNIERLVAMRDANRKPGPRVGIQLRVSVENVAQVCNVVEQCHQRFADIEPTFRIDAIPPGHPTALAELRRARTLARALGFRRTLASVDAALVERTRDPAGACHAPWYSCHIGPDGEVYPCGHHPRRAASVGNALARPFPEVWNGPRMRAFRAGLREARCADRVCATCRSEDALIDRVFGVVADVAGRARGRSGAAPPRR